MLNRHPSKVNVWEIVNLLETRVLLLDCLNDPDVCPHVPDCMIRPTWGKAYDAMKRIFEETTLQDILQNQKH